ncbi:hypothetical protein [Alteromonas lipotrueiana]|uniref:hypothetical protein n=1 Tax=Alteromonas lipotrueiana TaxID=2803815 RepID=UPI001C48F335|nr:hypothetical protein [Alteromonas lipotrueiana]
MAGYLIAPLVACMGIGLLLAGWQGRLPRFHHSYKPVGWACIAATPWLWHFTYGWRFAIAFAVLTVMSIALLVIYWQREVRPPAAIKPSARQPVKLKLAVPGALWQLWRAGIALPLAGITSMLLTVAVTRYLPWSSVNIIALGVYTMPFVWGGLAYWSLADRRTWRPPVALLTLGALAYLLLYA